MTRPAARIALAFVVVIALSLAASARTQQFRGGVDVVTLDVSVTQGNVPVPGLTSKDFIVTDNGVRQSVDAVLAGALPLDLTLAVDTSGSVEHMKDELKRQVRLAAGLLKPQDRIRLLTFSWVATQVFDLQPASGDLPLDRFTAGGATSLNDALAAALMRIRPAGRGELSVVFTDGRDTVSSMSMPMLEELARRSDVPLHVYIVRTPEDVAEDARFGRPDLGPITRLAESTGGRLDSILADNHITVALARVLDDYRTSYTLRFTATGVARTGWHELAVKLDRPGEFVVRARKGYFGG